MNLCRDCVHFRSAPYEAKDDGCYNPELMEAKQSAYFLDEQQMAGNHRKLNPRGDCEHFEAAAVELPWYKRLFSTAS